MNSNLIRKPFSSNNRLILVAAILTLIAACYLNLHNNKPNLVISKQDTAININTKFLMLLSAGHKRLITDLIWTQTLIESDIEHYKKKDLNSWLFLRFNTISALDPKFYQNYLYGGQFLGIVKDDIEGAKIIYQKGLEQYPDDYQLNFQAGFLYYFEAGDFKNGLKYLSRVESNPKAPMYLKSITNKLRLQVDGDLENIFALVLLNYQTAKDDFFKQRLRNDLFNIKTEIDLKCLNGPGNNCSNTDLDGNRYVQQNGLYKSLKPFKPFRIHLRK
jgi:hypothetical protein